MVKKVNIREMKRIAKEIMESESKKYGINIEIRPITFIDIINPRLFKSGNYTIEKRKRDFLNYIDFNCGGYNDLKGTTVIFLNKLEGSSLKKIDSVYLLANACYHEARHSAQQQFDRYSYARFLLDIECFFMKINACRHYKRNHDEYSFEIGANLYSTRMAREYLKSNYPLIYEREKERINEREEHFLIDYKLYDAFYFIDKVIPSIKNSRQFYEDESTKRNFINAISPVLSIFLKDSGSFKRPNEVINNDKYQELDKRIWYIMFSSLSFLDDLEMFGDLSQEEVNVINEAIEYSIKLCWMQLIYYERLLIIADECVIQQQDRINKKIFYLTTYLSRYQREIEYLRSLKLVKNSR